MDLAIGSTENARTTYQVVLVDTATGAAIAVVPAGGGAEELQVQGTAAANAAIVGNSVLVGGRVGVTQTAYGNNDAPPSELGTRGHFLGRSRATRPSLRRVHDTPYAFADRQGGAARTLATVAYLNNGTSLDQRQKPSAVSRIQSSSASTHATVAKASSADLTRVIGRNADASIDYLKLYNKASVPDVGVDTPAMSVPWPPASTFSFDLREHYFPAGLAYALTQGSGDTEASPIGAGDILGLNVAFA